MGKPLVVIGLLIAVAGALMMWGVPIGRLPGDFSWSIGNVKVYVPFTTSILVSLVLALLMAFLNR